MMKKTALVIAAEESYGCESGYGGYGGDGDEAVVVLQEVTGVGLAVTVVEVVEVVMRKFAKKRRKRTNQHHVDGSQQQQQQLRQHPCAVEHFQRRIGWFLPYSSFFSSFWMWIQDEYRCH